MSSRASDVHESIDVTTLGDLLVRTTNRYPDNDLLVFPERRVTYSQLREWFDSESD